MTEKYEPLSEAELVEMEGFLASWPPDFHNDVLRDVKRFVATIRDLQGQVSRLQTRSTPTADEIRAQVQAMKKAVEDGTATEYDVILGEDPREG